MATSTGANIDVGSVIAEKFEALKQCWVKIFEYCSSASIGENTQRGLEVLTVRAGDGLSTIHSSFSHNNQVEERELITEKGSVALLRIVDQLCVVFRVNLATRNRIVQLLADPTAYMGQPLDNIFLTAAVSCHHSVEK